MIQEFHKLPWQGQAGCEWGEARKEKDFLYFIFFIRAYLRHSRIIIFSCQV
jgi:hypothetical protein